MKKNRKCTRDISVEITRVTCSLLRFKFSKKIAEHSDSIPAQVPVPVAV